MPNLLTVLDENSFESLDETLKPFYSQNSENKKYFINIAPDEAEKIAFNLQTKFNNKKEGFDKLHKEHNELKTKYAAFEAFGKSPDELKAELDAKNPEEIGKVKADYEAKIASIQESSTEAMTKESERRAKAEKIAEQMRLDTEVEKLRNEFELNETAPYVLKEFLRTVRNEETGDISVAVFENDAPALLAGQPKTAKQLLEEFREQKKFLSMFNANGGGGSNASNNQQKFQGSSKVMKRADFDRIATSDPQKAAEFMQGGGRLED